MPPSIRLLCGLWLAVASSDGRAAAPQRVELGQHVELGQSVAGRAIVAQVYGQDAASETLLLIASIHGSEPAGTPLLERFEQWLAERPDELTDKRLVIVRVANPDGYELRERLNSRGVDLNRNFPADNRVERSRHGPEALSEPEARALMRALTTYAPDRVLSLHQPVACIDFDGPGRALAEAMSAAIEGRLPVKQLGGRPGSLGSYVGMTLKRPIITLELPKGVEQRSAESLWNDYGAAVVVFVRGVE